MPDAPAPDREQRLEEIRRRSEAATPGPWRWGGASDWEHMAVPPTGNDDKLWSPTGAVHSDGSARGEYGADIDTSGPDAAFIAHAREDVPFLLAELEAARLREDGALKLLEDGRAENDRLRGQLQALEKLQAENAAVLDRQQTATHGLIVIGTAALQRLRDAETETSRLTAELHRARAALASPAPEKRT